MTTIYLDIETIPTQKPQIIEHVKRNVKAPSNYKDPDKIAAYIEAASAEVVHKTGLSGLFGQVLCVGYAVDDQPVDTLYLDDLGNEKDLLATLRAGICERQAYCTNRLVGHNIINFDAPFLSQRMMINGLKPLFRHGVKPWDMSIDDTMTMFACGSKNMYSLKDLCLAFGVESPKSNMDGSEVYQAYLDGKHDEIKAYCADDVEATRAVYQQMTIQEAA